MFYTFLIVILCLVLVLHIIMMIAVMMGFFYKVPYVPSKKEKILSMLTLAKIKEEDHVVDLGCGDGKILAYAAKFTKGSTFTGYEIAPIPLFFFYLRKFLSKSPITVVRKSFFQADLSSCTVLLLYLLPETLDSLLPKLQQDLKKGTRVVSNTFKFSNIKPVETIEDNTKRGTIYLYEF